MESIRRTFVRKHRGKWQLGIVWRDDETGKERAQTRLSSVPYGEEGGANLGKDAALQELGAWRREVSAQKAAKPAPAASRRGKEDSRWTERRGWLDLSVEDFLWQFVDHQMLGRNTGRPIEASTKSVYGSLIRNEISPTIGQLRVRDLVPDDVRKMLWSIQEEQGLSAGMAKKAFNLLRSAMRYACELGLEKDPTRGVTSPRIGRPRLNSLDVDAADALVTLLKGLEPEPAVIAARLALACGLREGEMCALRFSDFDARAGYLHVHSSIARSTTGARGCQGKRGEAYIKGPKSLAGVRDIPLNPEISGIYQDAKMRMRRLCAAEGTTIAPELFILGRADGSWLAPANLGKKWSDLSRSFGLRGMQGKNVTLHDLRHTFATCAIAKGADIKFLQTCMGHSSAAVTLDLYASVSPVTAKSTMQMLSRD